MSIDECRELKRVCIYMLHVVTRKSREAVMNGRRERARIRSVRE